MNAITPKQMAAIYRNHLGVKTAIIVIERMLSKMKEGTLNHAYWKETRSYL